MSLTEVVDQITYSFMFIVTPLQIVSTKSIKNLKKSLLLRLGDKTSKTSQMNKSIEIPLQVMYSRTLRKYCPIKGIIKVYDINQDGSEVISSVGGFQTEQILNQQKTSTIIEKSIGTSNVKMKIQIKNLGVVDHKHHKIEKESQELQVGLSKQNVSTKNSVLQVKSLNSSVQAEFNNKIEKPVHHYFKRSANINVSPVPQTSKVITPIKKDITDTTNHNLPLKSLGQSIPTRNALQMGNQARQQITPNSNQQKQVDSQTDLDKLKKEIQEYRKQRDETLSQFQRFQQCFESKNSKIWVQFYEKLKTLSWKYKNKHFDQVFDEFFSFILHQLQKKPINEYTLQYSPQPDIEPNHLLNDDHLPVLQIDNFLPSMRTINQQQSSLSSIMLDQKHLQCQQLHQRITQLQSQNTTLHNQNSYMREKDDTMQQIISQKQTQIQNLKQQISEIQLQFKQLQATMKNDSCEIEQLRQQVSNLTQTIQTYREKFGDLKIVKNRALENQLKQCLLWIDQQTRDLQISDFEDDTLSASHSHNNVSDIIKSIELQVQGTSKQQMNSIKQELAGLIKRIDNFLLVGK